MRVCGTDGQCTDEKTDLSDEEWNKRFYRDPSIKLKDGNIYKNGEFIGTFENRGIDGAPFSAALIQAGRQPYEKAIGAFALASVVGGVTGGTAYYFATPFLAPTVTTLGLRAAPLLPAVPGAIQKLQKLGISLEQANAIVRSPASQKLIDLKNDGNVDVIQEVGGKLVRITTDPSGQRIISAGIMRANQITNGIASGRFVKK